MKRDRVHPRALLAWSAALLLALVLLVAGAAVLSGSRPLDARHQPQAWAEPFDVAGASYAGYLDWAGRQLRQGLQRDELPHALAPYRLDPPTDCPAAPDKAHHNGIVLMHDVQESPYQWRELAEYFRERCFVVVVPLLPGHGTVPGDLLRSHWQDWVALQHLAARELAGEVTNLFLGGHGVGATLALLEAARNEEVDALVLFAPVLAPQALPWHASIAALTGAIAEGSRWGEIYEDELPYRQDSWPLSLRQQVNALVAATQQELPGRVAALPVFSVASREDAEADPAAILAFMRELRHPDRQTVLYARAALPDEEALTQVTTERPDLGLYGLGHEALLMSTGDRVFGQQGSYHDCRHYREQADEAWQRCLAGEAGLWGEPAPDTLALGLLRKPAFNPFLVELQRELDLFLAPVGRILPVLVF